MTNRCLPANLNVLGVWHYQNHGRDGRKLEYRCNGVAAKLIGSLSR